MYRASAKGLLTPFQAGMFAQITHPGCLFPVEGCWIISHWEDRGNPKPTQVTQNQKWYNLRISDLRFVLILTQTTAMRQVAHFERLSAKAKVSCTLPQLTIALKWSTLNAKVFTPHKNVSDRNHPFPGLRSKVRRGLKGWVVIHLQSKWLGPFCLWHPTSSSLWILHLLEAHTALTTRHTLGSIPSIFASTCLRHLSNTS